PPQITWRGVLIAGVCWIVFAQTYASVVAILADVPFVYLMPSMVLEAGILAALSVPAWWVLIRRLDNSPKSAKVLAHFIIGPLYVVGTTWIYLEFTRWSAGDAAYGAVLARAGWIGLTHAMLYGIVFAVFHAVRASQRSAFQEGQAERLAALARERQLETLRAQLQPHFLFNTLNVISAMVGRDAEEARQMIADLSELLRRSLDGTTEPMVPFEEEVRSAELYLRLQRRRFPDRLKVDIDVEPEAAGVPVPSLIVQPLLENAVRHGIAPAPGGGIVRLKAHRENGHLHVVVEDTGVGDEGAVARAQAGSGIGIRNADARLKARFGSGLTLAHRAPHGFRVSFDVPA
ncbi:MAG: histidine kinase, partial [Bacteroidota bacterium]